MPRRVSPLGLTLSLLFIATATLIPTEGRAPNVGSFCLGCGEVGMPDLVLNILLFAPLGLVLGRAGTRPLVVLGIGLLLSASIEAAQLFIPGRAPTLRDVLTNALGCGIGGLAAMHLRAWIAPGRRAVILLWSAVAGALLAVWLTGTLLRFDPPEGIYYGQWVPDQRHLEHWAGTLQEASLGSLAVPNGPSDASDALRSSLETSAHVRVRGTGGPPTRRLGAIFAITTDAQREAILIGPHGYDLVVRVRRRAATWRLDAPEFRFRYALLPVGLGTPLAIEFRGTPQGGCATVNGVRHCVGRSAAGSTWMLARPYDAAPWWMQRLLDAITLFVLAFPAGLLLRGAPRNQAVAAGATLLIGLPATAWSSGLAFPSAWDWAGVLTAVGVGVWLHARLHPSSVANSVPPRPPGTPTLR